MRISNKKNRNFNRAILLIALLVACIVLIQPSYALFSLGGTAEQQQGSKLNSSLSTLTGALTSQVTAVPDSPLLSALSSQLTLSPEQATGGTGAMLALAADSLTSSQLSELTRLLPEAAALQNSLPGLDTLAGSLTGVGQVFSALGLNPGLISQFAPVILQYLSTQGASSGLLTALSGAWGG